MLTREFCAENMQLVPAAVAAGAARAAGRITILPGGGITWENAERIAAELGVGEVHGTKIVRLP
ncbi:MAG: copper homeostasis protein CutC [Atopobiaceae bacterium]|nr:copper homeostasis protein CutC [Atopobiaceae bacterium]